jgi:4-hydroxy-2-oxoheptanedioate aldolase
MRGELIRENLHEGKRVYGSHVCSLTNPLTAKMEAEVEFDFIFICNEHMPIDRTETAMMCQLYAAHGISPVVRIPCAKAHYAAMALDAGAQGIVVPYVETVEEVKAIVGAVKYRPIKGRFLREVLDGKREPTPKTAAFLREFNRDNYVIIGVESVEAVENLDALLGVRGVDGVFLGPHDLTVSMEIPTEYENPRFLDLVEDVIRRCRKAHVGVGIHLLHLMPGLKDAACLPATLQTSCVRPDTLKRFLDAGLNWILNSSDITMITLGLNNQFAALRQMMGDTYARPSQPGERSGSCAG